jgi:hypothetical protein
MRITSFVLKALGAALIGVIGACSDATAPDAELDAARKRWTARGPASYSIVLVRGCECTVEMVGPVRVVVLDRAIQSRQYVRSGAEVSSVHAELFPSVEGLFQLIERARRQGADDIAVLYDPTLGHPVSISIDYDARAVDDELGFNVMELQAISTLDRSS